MGDRCHLRLTLHGHIDTLEHMRTIIAAIRCDGLRRDYTGQDGEEQFLDEFAEALVNKTNPMFSDNEVNYGSIDHAQDVLTEHGVAWSVDHDAGGSYGAGMRSFIPDKGFFEAESNGDDPVIAVRNIEECLTSTDPIAAITALVKDARYATGVDDAMPTFSVGDEIKALLAVRIAKAALNIEDAA